MKAYRFMSKKEFNKMSIGLDIIGKNYFKARTTSTGVCFMSESIHAFNCSNNEKYGEKYEFDINTAYQFLFGIVSSDIVVEFEVNCELTLTSGVYAHPWGGWEDLICADEYCVPMYNRESMRPIRYGFADFDGNIEWYTFN